MTFRLLVFISSVLLGPFIWAASESGDESGETPKPEARPHLYDPMEMSPYHHAGMGYLDPWYFHSGPYFHYASRYGYGYRSALYYNMFYGFFPEPGHSELSVSIGSDNYFGTSISNSGYLDKKLGITYNISALWESGETYWSHRDYDSFTISPSFFWSNENTALYVGFSYTETRFEDGNMSPFRIDAQNVENQSDSSQFRPIWIRELSDYTLKRATIGIEHQFSDFLTIGLQFESSDFKSKR